MDDVRTALALHEMISRSIGAVVVTNGEGPVLGVISERDVIRALCRDAGRVLHLPIRDVMSRSVPTCRPDDSTTTCMATMTRSRHRHLPVVVDGQLRGLVSIGDLVKHRLDDLELERDVLREAYLSQR